MGLINISSNVQWVGSFLIFISCLPLFKYRSNAIKFLFYYSASSILFQLAQELLGTYYPTVVNNNFIGNGFVLSEVILLGLVYWSVLKDDTLKKFVAGSIVVYALYFILVWSFFVENSFSLLRLGRDIHLIGVSILYFYYLLKTLPEESIVQSPMFWFSSGAIFFFSGTFILSLTANYIIKELGNDFELFWSFRNFFRFVFCLIITYAVWLDWRLLKQRAT